MAGNPSIRPIRYPSSPRHEHRTLEELAVINDPLTLLANVEQLQDAERQLEYDASEDEE